MTSELFFQNIGTILLYAVLGTIFNTFAVGASLYGVSGYCKVNYDDSGHSFAQCACEVVFTFGFKQVVQNVYPKLEV